MNNKTKMAALVVAGVIILALLWFKFPQTNETAAVATVKSADVIPVKPNSLAIKPPPIAQLPVQPPASSTALKSTSVAAVNSLAAVADQSQIDAARNFVTKVVRDPLGKFGIDYGYYPSSRDGLRALIENVDGDPDWRGPYFTSEMQSVPLDPWGHEYQYQFPGVHNPDNYDVWSIGPDGISGTADDIGNW